MDDHLPLGAIVRASMLHEVHEGMLVRRHRHLAPEGEVLTIVVADDDQDEYRCFAFHSNAARVELMSLPPPGSMLVTYGVHTNGHRVRHLASSRLAAVDWLDLHLPNWKMEKDVAILPAVPGEQTWSSPVPLRLVPSRNSRDFLSMPAGTTGVPIGDDHPGAFGFRRRHHVHEGVDLYVPEGTTVRAVEDGVVTAVIPFTGTIASPPTPFWNDTWAVLVEGASGTVVYGEIDGIQVSPGDRVLAGDRIGQVRQVLIRQKSPPRPMSMLHLELHRPGTTDACEWPTDGPRPPSLLNPTELLLSAALGG